MKIGTLFGAMALVSACSMTIIPQGAAQSRSAQADGEWVAGDVPTPAATPPAYTPVARNGAPATFEPVDPAQLVKIGDDSTALPVPALRWDRILAVLR
ncbi:hypothetical protein [Sphingopyxis sp. BSNA05]|uniref:hypothetical protein n=1 Tax=Sphingopyxis sp. BSNA05 TaxID=1236614 RepID=UPI0015653363|nr:hypothetical protein [Sphingopyxis sp. BSNA05]